MLDLIHAKVIHKAFGKGTVIGMNDTTVTIAFSDKISKFVYPNAFEKYLTLENIAMANEMENQLNQYKEAEEAKKKIALVKAQERLAVLYQNVSDMGTYRKITKNVKVEIPYNELVYDVPVVDIFEDVMYNCDVIDGYISSRKDPEYSYALNLIKRGTCFLAIEVDGQYKFYPSRFIGYYNNSMKQHERNGAKDGTVTNPAISFAIDQGKPVPNPKLDVLYREYCKSLGFSASDKGSFGVERKYWVIHLTS